MVYLSEIEFIDYFTDFRALISAVATYDSRLEAAL